MDKVNQKMKKFNFRGVFDGIRGVTNTPKAQLDGIEETLRSEDFQVAKTVRHGFPFQPTAMAYDPVQNLLAIGTNTGSLRIFGRPGVDCHVQHEGGVAVIQVLFLVNEGLVVTACAAEKVGQLHMWNLGQKSANKKVDPMHTLVFQREKITQIHLPLQSKWLYVGTERGNVHIVNIESFVLSGYVINWNKAIELTRKTHPGPVVHLSDNPMDPGKLLIGFESGTIVLWDLKSKTAEYRYSCTESLKSVCWHHEGKTFMCSHADGSLTTWNVRAPQKPHSILMPHAKVGKDGKPEPCKPIQKVEWCSVRTGEPYMIFSGGMPYDKASRTPCLTVMHGKSTTVLEMEHNVIDFLPLNSTPWNNDFQDPYGIVVLLQNDLVVVDLTTPGYPCFENPYPMDLHESPVTACKYYADCPPDLIPAFYSVGSKQKKTGFSEKDWPVKGGEWGTTPCSYPEIIITGHADGSLKFWDASAVTLQVLYKLKTAKVFDKSRCRNPDPDDDPFAVQHIHLCCDSRLLCVAGINHVILFKFSKTEANIECPCLEMCIVYEIYDDLDSPGDVDYPPCPPAPSSKPSLQAQHSGSMGSYSSTASDKGESPITCVKLKSGSRKWSPGYQPDLCCILQWFDGDPPPNITSVSVNSRYGLLAFGNECGLAIVDITQKTCLLNMGTPDLYGSLDPYSRAPRSPKSRPGGGGSQSFQQQLGQQIAQQLRPDGLDAVNRPAFMDEAKSPTADQSPADKGMGASSLDSSSFSRSRSSSMSSLENVSKEAIQCLLFADAYTRKSDPSTVPCLWVGTSLGSVLVINLSLPAECDRKTEPVIVSPSGTIFRLKGAILAMSFLDCKGILIPAVAEAWQEPEARLPPRERKVPYNRQQSMSALRSSLSSPTSSSGSQPEMTTDRQFAIMCSEKQARVISLPSQLCAFKVKITETSIVTVADVVSIKDSVCLACYVANGHIITFSLPSLRPLLDVDYLPLTDVRIAKTFCFSANGHSVYFCSPTEMQKITLSAEISERLTEMLGELFMPCDTPEAPKKSFLQNLFGGGTNTLDREELFGEMSGKASKGVAVKVQGNPRLGQTQERASGACSEISRAKQLAMERGEKLGQVDENTERMRDEAEEYARNAHALMIKYKNKKWYQF